jgi:NAD(P)H-dependent FMN reductase
MQPSIDTREAHMLKLHVIIGSTRPGRLGLPVGTWAHGFAQSHGKFETRLVDLAEVNLPIFDEPRHPRLKQYEHAHTRAWSAIVAEADAYLFVTPEYNYSAPPSLLNAIDFVYHEWSYKPVAFVSYGGIAGGARAVMMLKQLSTSVKMMPMFEGVGVPFFTQQIENGVFKPTAAQETAATAMLDELLRWAGALKTLR